MIVWEAHACLPLHPRADFAPIDRLHAAAIEWGARVRHMKP